MYLLHFKYHIDKIISVIILFFFSPILFFVYIIILIIDKHNPIFIHERAGYLGRPIKIFKFKTIKVSSSGVKIITPLGKLLRFLKIDELPQLLNILNGNLSLIGPRPLLLSFNNYYKKNHSFRLNIRPGLTGLAQIKLRDSTNWERKFDFDLIYISKISLKLDLFILLATIKLIFYKIFKSKKYKYLESIDYEKDFYENYVNKKKNNQ